MKKTEPYMLDILFKELADEYSLETITTIHGWSKSERDEYYADIREWLADVVEEGGEIVLGTSSIALQVVCEPLAGKGCKYYQVRYNAGNVWAIREELDEEDPDE